MKSRFESKPRMYIVSASAQGLAGELHRRISAMTASNAIDKMIAWADREGWTVTKARSEGATDPHDFAHRVVNVGDAQ